MRRRLGYHGLDNIGMMLLCRRVVVARHDGHDIPASVGVRKVASPFFGILARMHRPAKRHAHHGSHMDRRLAAADLEVSAVGADARERVPLNRSRLIAETGTTDFDLDHVAGHHLFPRTLVAAVSTVLPKNLSSWIIIYTDGLPGARC